VGVKGAVGLIEELDVPVRSMHADPAFAVERMVTRARLKVWGVVREGET
jgi:hypothetical protein